MHLRYVLSELGQGLRRNLSMHVAVILTLFVSLSLAGGGLLLQREADLVADHLGDELKIKFTLCTNVNPTDNPNCADGEVTDQQRNQIERAFDESPDVAGYTFASKQEGYDTARELFSEEYFEGDPPIITVEDYPAGYWVTLKDPEEADDVISAVVGLDGVAGFQDQRETLAKIYRIMDALRIGALGGAVVLLAVIATVLVGALDLPQALGGYMDPTVWLVLAAYFLARTNGRVVGRIAAIKNDAHNKEHADRVGFYGFFESVNDQTVANALFDRAARWLRERGFDTMRGPMSPSVNDECGLLVWGFETPPALMMPHNPEYYVTLTERAGFAKAMDLLVYESTGTRMPERLVRGAKLVAERKGVTLRPHFGHVVLIASTDNNETAKRENIRGQQFASFERFELADALNLAASELSTTSFNAVLRKYTPNGPIASRPVRTRRGRPPGS